jgi:hypothetical protein
MMAHHTPTHCERCNESLVNGFALREAGALPTVVCEACQRALEYYDRELVIEYDVPGSDQTAVIPLRIGHG